MSEKAVVKFNSFINRRKSFMGVSSARNIFPDTRSDQEVIDKMAEQFDEAHYLMLLVTGANWSAPLSRPAIALDIGCGTGTWVMEMAARFPGCQWYGIDKNPLFPDSIHPPNTHFFHMDILCPPLRYPNGHFDFVHQRFLLDWIPTECWPAVLTEIVRLTKPGGWIELKECDFIPHSWSGLSFQPLLKKQISSSTCSSLFTTTTAGTSSSALFTTPPPPPVETPVPTHCTATGRLAQVIKEIRKQNGIDSSQSLVEMHRLAEYGCAEVKIQEFYAPIGKARQQLSAETPPAYPSLSSVHEDFAMLDGHSSAESLSPVVVKPNLLRPSFKRAISDGMLLTNGSSNDRQVKLAADMLALMIQFYQMYATLAVQSKVVKSAKEYQTLLQDWEKEVEQFGGYVKVESICCLKAI